MEALSESIKWTVYPRRKETYLVHRVDGSSKKDGNFIKSIKWTAHPIRMETLSKSIKWMVYPRRMEALLSP